MQPETSTTPRRFEGTFVVDAAGAVSFTCSTHGVSFAEVLAGFKKMRDELTRQIDNQHLCPHYTPPTVC